jgi:hypothetical protein
VQKNFFCGDARVVKWDRFRPCWCTAYVGSNPTSRIFFFFCFFCVLFLLFGCFCACVLNFVSLHVFVFSQTNPTSRTIFFFSFFCVLFLLFGCFLCVRFKLCFSACFRFLSNKSYFPHLFFSVFLFLL